MLSIKSFHYFFYFYFYYCYGRVWNMATSKPVYICKLFYDFRRAWIIEWHWTNSLSSKSNKEIQNNLTL